MADYAIFLSWGLFGLVAGVAAKLLTPGRDPGGLLSTAALGVAGALLGDFVYVQCSGEEFTPARQFSLSGMFLAVVGASLLLIGRRIAFGEAPRRGRSR